MRVVANPPLRLGQAQRGRETQRRTRHYNGPVFQLSAGALDENGRSVRLKQWRVEHGTTRTAERGRSGRDRVRIACAPSAEFPAADPLAEIAERVCGVRRILRPAAGGYAFRLLGNLQDAEDVVQEVFVRAFSDRSKRTEVTAVGPYLYRAVANACTDVLRKRSRAEVFCEEVDMSQLLGKSQGPREAAEAAEALRRAEALLGRLPKDQAEAIRLRVFDELRLKEIAGVMGCPIDTVCSRLRYGFQKLRSLIVKEPE